MELRVARGRCRAKAPCRRAPLWSGPVGDVGLKHLCLPRAPIFPLPQKSPWSSTCPTRPKSQTGGRRARSGKGNPKFGIPFGEFAHGGGFLGVLIGFFGNSLACSHSRLFCVSFASVCGVCDAVFSHARAPLIPPRTSTKHSIFEKSIRGSTHWTGALMRQFFQQMCSSRGFGL